MKSLLCGAVLTATFSACGESSGPYFGTTAREGKDQRTLFVNNGGEPEYIDPGKSHDSIGSKLIENLFEGLVIRGPDAEPVPGVAARFERSDDHRYFRFHLRPDAKWSDGKDVTANDFEFAWKRVLSPKTASQSSPQLYFLRNAELFNQGRLARLSRDVEIRSSAGQPPSVIAKGAAAYVVARSPVTLRSPTRPLADPDSTLSGFELSPSAKKAGFAELRGVRSGEEVELPLDEGFDRPLAILGRSQATTCNGEKDYYFELGEARTRARVGYLPGCALSPVDTPEEALIAAWNAEPTFDPKTRTEPPQDLSPIGFVPADALESDPQIVGVRAVSPSILEIEAEFPVPYILDVLCTSPAAPVRQDIIEAFEKRGEPDLWTRPETIVTNGPYKISDWKFRYEIRMTRNPTHRHFDDLKIHDIVWTSVEAYVPTMNLYKSGELDFIGDNSALPAQYLSLLSTKKDFETTPYLATYWYELNTESPPLNDARVRRALNLSIDKRLLVSGVLKGNQIPATHVIPDVMGGGYKAAVDGERHSESGDRFRGRSYGFDPELARSLLKEAGFDVQKDGDTLTAVGFPPIDLLYNTSESHRAVAVAIQDMWKTNLGISVQLRNEEWHIMLKNVRDKNFNVVRFGWVADYDHPQTYMDTFMSQSPNNRTGWSNAQFDSLVQRARTSPDPTESMRLYRDAEQILMDEVPKIPLYFYTKSTLMKPYVKGFHFNPRSEHLIQWMWIDPNWATNSSDEPAFPVDAFPPAGAYQ